MCLGEIGRVTGLSEGRAEVGCGPRVITVSTIVLDERVAVGDWLLVHSGLALARLDEAEALAALELRETGPR